MQQLGAFVKNQRQIMSPGHQAKNKEIKMNKTMFETIIGAAVMLVAIFFAFFAMDNAEMQEVDGYSIKAKFENASGLSSGTDVRVGGIKVGTVQSMRLDTDNYNAIVTMQIKESVKLPSDSSAAIVSDGLLGSKYMAIEPGGDNANLNDGDEIEFTQSSVSLETLISKLVFSGNSSE